MKELDHLGLSVNTVPKSGEEHVRLHSLRRDAVDAFLNEPVASSWSAEKLSDFDLASFGHWVTQWRCVAKRLLPSSFGYA
jgi:hypothetical protein